MARVPLYRAIETDLTSRIARGEFAPGSPLPSEVELASQYGVTRMTLRQALTRLEDAALLVRQQGRGSFVSSTWRKTRRLNRLRSFAEEIDGDEVSVEGQVLLCEVTDPPAAVVSALRLSEGQFATHLKRLRLVNGQPAACQDAWISFRSAPSLAHEDLIEGSLYRTLHEKHGVEFGWADQVVTAVAATPEIAELLGVAEASPIMEIRRTTYDKSKEPVEFVHSWTRSDLPLVMRLDV